MVTSWFLVRVELILRGARHPLLDQRLHSLRLQVFGESERRDPDHQVVPLDFRMPEDAKVLVISGPNAGGKTVALKTVGVSALLFQCGIQVPCSAGSEIPIFERVFGTGA